MPTKKPSARKRNAKPSKSEQKAKAAYRAEIRKNFKILFIVLAVIAGICFSIQCVVWFNMHNEAIAGQKRLESYLEKKYNKGFVVEKPVHKGYGFGIEGSLVSVAYPEDNSNLKFKAWTSSLGSNDKYPEVLWKQQARDYLKPAVIEAFGYTPEFTVELFTANTEAPIIRGTLPPGFSDALSEYSDGISIVLTVLSQEDISANETLAARRVYDLVKVLEKMNLFSFSVDYQDSAGKEYDDENRDIVGSVEDILNSMKEGGL